MISWGGTVSVTVRRLTRTIRSIVGISRISPGPRWSISRPSRNTTPRSYSRRTRIEAATPVSPITSSTARTMMIAVIIGPAPTPRRAHRKRQPVQVLDDDRIARVQIVGLAIVVRVACAPERAVDEHLPIGSVQLCTTPT